MRGYDFHPEAETDLNEAWEYIAFDSVGHGPPYALFVRGNRSPRGMGAILRGGEQAPPIRQAQLQERRRRL